MSSMESIALKTSIRAFAYRTPILLSSCGSFISVWKENGREFPTFVKKFSIDISQAIIGIKFEESSLRSSHSVSANVDNITEQNVLIYSIKLVVFSQLRICYKDGIVIHCELKHFFKANLNYWIIDCVFENGWAYILNSRNQVLIYDLTNRRITANIFGPQKCILYSGLFVNYSHNWIVIASGTVFRTVLLWAIEFDSEKNCWHLINIQALKGHDGVIFSIDYNSHINALISASDDRSIRIWSGSKGQNCTSQDSKQFWKNNQFSLSKIYYGHAARIWKVTSTFVQEHGIVISTGEDASIFVWSLLPPYSMIQKKSLFKNNRLWCFKILQNCVAFGGSDSSIKFIAIDDLLNTNQFQIVRSEFEINLSKATCYLDTGLNSHQLFVSSSKGNFNVIDNDNILHKLQFNEFLDYKVEDIFSDYICLDSNPSRTQTIVASKFGHIALIAPINGQLKLIFIKNFFESKIFNVSFVDENRFICCLAAGQVYLFSIENQIVHLKEEYILPVTRHPWTSCGVLIKNVLIVGSFSGSVFAFKTNVCDPISQYRHVHGPNGVTSIKERPHSNFVYSCGRNGKIIEFLTETDRSNRQILALQLLRTFFIFSDMDWVSGFLFESTFPFTMKYAYGFESKYFLLWNLIENRIIFQEECGGGHRSWNLFIDDKPTNEPKLKFCYTKKDKLLTVERSLPSMKSSMTEMFSSLPRKINSCSQVYASEQVSYFLLGGEDTIMQIVHFDLRNQSLRLWATLWGHISNISSIKCLCRDQVENGQKIIDVVSVGGRSQLIVWKFTITPDEELICQERASNFLGLFDEHILFEDYIRKATKEALPLVDIRYLDVDFCFLSVGLTRDLLILVACSDCAFRLYRYNDTERRIIHTEKIESGSSCILVSRLLSFNSQSSPNILPNNICALASTDGNLCLWSLLNEPNEDDNLVEGNPILSCKLHQAGINSLDFRVIQNTLLVLTGGDDNALKVTRLLIDKDNSSGAWTVSQLSTVEEASIHSCQITGLRFYSANTFVSASIDQKIISWQLSSSNGLENQIKVWDAKNTKLSLRALDTHISAVADISSIELISHDNLVLVCGEGLELVKVPSISCLRPTIST